LDRDAVAVATPVERQRSLAFAPAAHPPVSELGGPPHDRCLCGMIAMITPRTTSSWFLAFEVPASGSARPPTAEAVRIRHLSWGSSPSPPPTCPACVQSHDPEGPLRPEDAHPLVTFRPRGFTPPRRLPPHTGSRDVALRCQTGVRRVSTLRTLRDQTRHLAAPLSQSRSARWPSPRRKHPSKTTPRPQPLVCHHTSVPSCGLCKSFACRTPAMDASAALLTPATPGPSSVDGAGQPTLPVKAAQTPHLPWAFSPLQGPDDDAGASHPLASDVEHAHP
jgi:hypothetical protein